MNVLKTHSANPSVNPSSQSEPEQVFPLDAGLELSSAGQNIPVLKPEDNHLRAGRVTIFPPP